MIAWEAPSTSRSSDFGSEFRREIRLTLVFGEQPGKTVAGFDNRSRWIVAITGSLLINTVLLSFMFWREQVAHVRHETQIITLFLPRLDIAEARIHEARLPPAAPVPDLPHETTPASPSPAPVAASPAAPAAPASSNPPAPASSGPAQVAEAPVPLKLGCMATSTRGLTAEEKRDCWKTVQVPDGFRRPGDNLENYAVLEPPGPPTGPPMEPGWHWMGPVLIYVYGPEDKHFLPGQGSSVKHVFKPDEIYAVPKPR